MDFNIAYLGPEALYHLRRDFILGLKYALDDLGHRTSIGGAKLQRNRLNLVIGAYFLPTSQIHALTHSEFRIAHINTEIIADDMLNHNPEKVDFLGAYLPALQTGEFIWDAVIDNMEEHLRYQNNAHFLRWGWHPRIEDINHSADKDLDFYFFGLISPRRKEILASLAHAGLIGRSDNSCPYFQRNDFISRAKIQLNIAQDDVYSHVNSLRICYLSNNRCAIVSEPENDPAGYLGAVRIASKEDIPLAVKELTQGKGWRNLADSIYENYRCKPTLTTNIEELLDQCLAGDRKSERASLQDLPVLQPRVCSLPESNESTSYTFNNTAVEASKSQQPRNSGLLRRVFKKILN